MFENIIEQGAVQQLRDDILNRRCAPSMLFFGPLHCAKGSSALELSRALSCETDASWKCSCSSCERHRYLQHDDLLVMGPRSFSAEIAAFQGAFLQNPESLSVKLLFYRSLRKLQLRFSPVLVEDDPKIKKVAVVLQSFDEKLNELLANAQNFDEASRTKLCNSLVKDALALENDGLSGIITIASIRNVSSWCRLAPVGKRKMLIIENAENMRDEGRNSLLKLLEEPPSNVSIVLTARRREAIIPTILSRLRQYRFMKRSAESQKEVLRRIFQAEGSSINVYLDSFLVRSAEKLQVLAALFLVSLVSAASLSLKKKGQGQMPPIFTAIEMRYAPLAESTGLKHSADGSAVIKSIVLQSGNFENDSFSRFLKICLDMMSELFRLASQPQNNVYNDMFKKYINEAVTAVDVLNINAAITLEGLFYKLKGDLTSGSLSSRGFYG